MTDREIPPNLRTAPPPETGEQILAWAYDLDAHGYGKPDPESRWSIAQWAPDGPRGKPYWRSCGPGYVTRVHVIAWLPLPCLDRYGRNAKNKLVDPPTAEAVAP